MSTLMNEIITRKEASSIDVNIRKSQIRLLIMDVDGTLTDGKVYIGDSGEVMKAFDIKDGHAIYHILPKNNIIPAIITGRTSQIVKKRCEELKIKYIYQGINNKIKKMDELLKIISKELGEELTYKNVAYVGDDIIDLPCMNVCSINGCPGDAVKEVISISDFVSNRNGGNGAVREFIEWLVDRV